MKTAISIPDETFEQVERRAGSLGMSRSEFFTRAAQRYLHQLDEESLTADIDAAIELAETDDSWKAAVPGNVFLPAAATGLPRDSVVNVTALTTLNKSELEGPVGKATDALLAEVDRGLCRALGLSG